MIRKLITYSKNKKEELPTRVQHPNRQYINKPFSLEDAIIWFIILSIIPAYIIGAIYSLSPFSIYVLIISSFFSIFILATITVGESIKVIKKGGRVIKVPIIVVGNGARALYVLLPVIAALISLVLRASFIPSFLIAIAIFFFILWFGRNRIKFEW